MRPTAVPVIALLALRDQVLPPTKDPKPAHLVQALDDRADLEIRFPKLSGYRVELTPEHRVVGRATGGVEEL